MARLDDTGHVGHTLRPYAGDVMRWQYSMATCATTGHPVLIHRSGDKWVAPLPGAPGLLWCLAKRKALTR